MSEDLTTIAISKDTHDKLMKKGNKGETFDDIVKKLLENE